MVGRLTSSTESTNHVDLSDGTKEDDCKDGDGQPEGECVGHIPAEPTEPGSQEHHEQDGRPHKGRQEQEEENKSPRKDGQLDATQKYQKDQTAGQRTAETAVGIPLILSEANGGKWRQMERKREKLVFCRTHGVFYTKRDLLAPLWRNPGSKESGRGRDWTFLGPSTGPRWPALRIC